MKKINNQRPNDNLSYLFSNNNERYNIKYNAIYFPIKYLSFVKFHFEKIYKLIQ